MKLATLLLTPCSWFYKLGVRVRHICYDRGLFSTFASGVTTVSVGNLVMGGSGKTPIVALLASLLEKEYRVAIATRGYKGTAEKGKNPLSAQEGVHSWRQLGDEPYWLASRHKDALVIVGRKRCKSAALAKEKGCELLLLDDGMQHRKLGRDVEIVVVEGRDPFGGGYFFPRGRLREEPQRLAFADLVFINGMVTKENRAKLESLTQAPLVQGEMKVKRVVNRKGEGVEIKGKKVALFCAIGSPARFVETVRSYGSEVVATYFIPDHAPFEKKKVEQFALQAKKAGASFLCCTEKDGVKLFEGDDQILFIEGEFVIHENEESFRQLIRNIKSLAKEKR